MENGFLLYCIADNFDENLTVIRGMDDSSSIYSIEYKGLNAVLSVVDLGEYGEENMKVKGEDITWIAEKACSFMEIVQAINEKTVLIPMKFLTLFTSEDKIRDLIEENYNNFTASLEKLRGRVELSVKLYCNDKVFKNTSMGEEIIAFEKTLAGKPEGSAFFLRKKFDSDLDDKVQDKIWKTANSIIESGLPYCVEMKSLKLVPKEITGVREKMVLNCAFLVAENGKEAFKDYFRGLRDKYRCWGFLIECTGPWPPYDFC